MLPDVRTQIPGPLSRDLTAQLRAFESRNVTYVDDAFPIFWDRADGANVWDVDGNRFLDLTSAFAVAGLGHNHPAVRQALITQSERLIHAMGDVHPSSAKAALCAKLSEITFERWRVGPAKAILGNSGSDAIEAALKTALLHSGKPGVISFTGGYHGLGHGALETSGIPYFRRPFKPQLARFGVRIPFPFCYRCPHGRTEGFRLAGKSFPNCSAACLDETQKLIETAIKQREMGCILVEPLQGRGGEIAPPLDFLRLLREIADRHKVLLVFDEIYTGFNRTGRLFACEHAGVAPDIICLGKALTSGFPLSACVGRADIMDAWPESTGEALHTSTFLGNPIGCAMALASIEAHLDPATARLVEQTSCHLDAAIAALKAPAIGDIRGAGLMRGIELIGPRREPNGRLAKEILNASLRDGLLLLAGSPDGNVLSITPPFVISQPEIDHAVAKIQEYVTSLPGSVS
jgi:4-aminobutyrate aminotransferase-like enzyme